MFFLARREPNYGEQKSCESYFAEAGAVCSTQHNAVILAMNAAQRGG